MYFDRYIDNQKACPACDPRLGSTPEIRIQNYKRLVSPPVSEEMITSMREIANSLAEGFSRLIHEMKEADEFSEHTTFKDMCMFAGRNVIITEAEE